MAVSKRLRYEILRRDNHTCRYCGSSAPDVPLRVDHVTPVALGGSDKPENLATSCEPCNSGKSSATVDSAVVADVDATALRWADAMQQAAENLRQQETPKDEYRDTFLAEWNRWGTGEGESRKAMELPGDWKPSLERFRVAGLPAWVWADIVDTAMGYDKVLPANKFKYCCGIAWNKVTELQAEARRIVGPRLAPEDLDVRKSVLEAAFAVWHCGMAECEEKATAAQEDEFRRSLADLAGDNFVAPERIIQAAQHATYFGISNITDALRDMDRDAVWRAWIGTWPITWVRSGDEPWDGKYVGDPTDKQKEYVRKQIESLLDADVYVTRIIRAASHAGTHKSARIYSGLTEDELQATGVCSWQSRASELWRVAFTASGEIEPSPEETSAFFASLSRIGQDGGFVVADVYEAASAAGSYQDPDVTTCLTRRLSVFEAAALPVGSEN
jgi:hypothetical protein